MLRNLLFVVVAISAGVFAQAQTAPGVSALKGHNYNAPVEISADSAELQDRADRAVLVGNVHLTQGDLTLDTARLTIAYSMTQQNNGAPQIDRVDARGGVTVRSPSETAKGDFGIYDLNRKLITLLGNVQLVKGESNMQGSRLVIDLTSGYAVLDGGPPGVGPNGGRVTGHFVVPQRGQQGLQPK